MLLHIPEILTISSPMAKQPSSVEKEIDIPEESLEYMYEDMDLTDEENGLSLLDDGNTIDDDIITWKELEIEEEEIVLPQDELRYLLPIPEPSKEVKQRFQTYFCINDLFIVDDSDYMFDFFDSATKGKFSKKMMEEGLVELISGLFTEYFRRDTNLVMNSFFYLLCSNGERWTYARSFLITLHKWLGDRLVFEFDFEDLDTVESFSRFIEGKLRRYAICEVKQLPDFDERRSGKFYIRSTPFLRRFLKISSQNPLH